MTTETNTIHTALINVLNSAQDSLPSVGIKPLREKALHALQASGLPFGKNEEYRNTPLTRALEKSFHVEHRGETLSNIQDIHDIAIPGLDANILVFVNGVYQENLSIIKTASDSLIVKPLDKALIENPEIVKHLGVHSESHQDPFTNWNTAGWTSGIFIHVPKNMNTKIPVVIHHVQDASAPVISISRNLVVVEQQGDLHVIEKFDTKGNAASFSNCVSEIIVKENANFSLTSIQNDNGERYAYNAKYIHQSNASRVDCFTYTLDGKIIRNNLNILLDGEGCETNMTGLYLLRGDTLADNHTVVDHRVPHSLSNELYKGIMDESSRGVFNGKIFVRPFAQKTNAFQSNRNIILNDKATVNTKPQLEIWADDVKCSHGCTSGQLDEEAIFYLQSRGISKTAAQAMMLYAFAGEVIEKMKDEHVRMYIDSLISKRLHKDF